MITSINSIKKCGIFQDYKASLNILDFKKYNLLYGWNGSGKTTLSKMLRAIELQKGIADFPDAEFELECGNGQKITNKTLQNYSIKVFNQDFVVENLNLFDATTKPIIFLSKEKIEEKEKLDSLRSALKNRKEEKERREKEQNETKIAIENIHINAGKSIKDFFLGTEYANVNHNKSHSKNIWTAIKANGQTINDYLLTDQKLAEKKSHTLLNSELEPISSSILPQPYDLEKLAHITRKVEAAIGKKIAVKIIERLKEKPTINEWVRTGLEIHKEYNSLKCEFCCQTLPAGRLNELENHFNEEYKSFQKELFELIEELERGIRIKSRDVSHLFYGGDKPHYLEALEGLNTKIDEANELINHWIKLLKTKQQNPFEWPGEYISSPQIFDFHNDFLERINHIVVHHNEICNNYSIIAEKAKNGIENHFVSQFAIKEELIRKEGFLLQIREEILKCEKQISETSFEINTIEGELRNDTIAIEEINANLKKFLGRNEINLERIQDGGYQLKRSNKIATNLSEGEKTAISLVYFISKLKENNSKIEDTVVVMDDPISSFDSNHLFNASTFITNQCKEALQLFVLTHNFWFFKQLRDWMTRNKSEKCNFYSIKRGEILNAEKALVKYHSEYHYAFNNILAYSQKEKLSMDDDFNVANTARRVLEAFSNFKTPKDSGINGILELGLKRGFSVAQKERVYFFLNKFSHLDRIEAFDHTIENVGNEGKNVISDILELIRSIDLDHYESMLKICGHTPDAVGAN